MNNSNWMDEIDEGRWCFYLDRADLSGLVKYVSPKGTLIPSTDTTPGRLENLAGGISAPIPGPFADRLEYCVDRLDLDEV